MVVLVAALGCGGDAHPTGAAPLTGAGSAALPASGGTGAGTAGTLGSGVTGGSPAGMSATAGTISAGTNAATTGGTGGAGAADAGTDEDGAAPDDAGPVGQDAATPPIDLPLGASEIFPLPGATGLCDDPPLRIGFGSAPTLGSRGRIQVWADDQPGAAVATVDLGAGVKMQNRGGRDFAQPPPAYIDGNAAVFALPPGALARGRRYHVTIEDGVLRGPDGPVVVDDGSTWSFETAASGPGDRTQLSVGLDGKASFCTVQGALDAVPNDNTTATTIEIGAGGYFGLVHLQGKNNITLRGADRKATRITGVNNNNLNPSTRTRPLFSVEGASDITIEKLTIHNLTPQGGSQAEALALLPCDRCIVRDADVLSLQDTLLWTGRIYAENCFIAGNVDFVWGSGAVYFKGCEIKTVGRSGYIVQSRNGADSYGYVFVDSKLTADSGVSGVVLARIDAGVYPASHVAYIDCEMGPHISAGGWTVSNGPLGNSLRFWEYGSKDAAGKPISTAGRSQYSRQLSASEAAMMRDPAVVLAGWSP